MVTKTWGYLEVLTSSDLNGAFAECATLTGTETLTNKKLQLQNASATPEANTMVNEAIVKAWANVSSAGVINENYNVASVVKGTTGGHISYDITLKKAFSNLYYTIIVTPQVFGATNETCFASYFKNSTSNFKIFMTDRSIADAETEFSFIAIGPQ